MSLSGNLQLRSDFFTPPKDGFRFLSFICFFFAFTFIFSFNVNAQGNLLVTPRRVVFDGSQRSISLNLANVGSDTATYAISLIQIRMTEEGRFETITEPDEGQNFADKNLRYFPRSVTLPPNEAQVVKVQVTKSNKLEPGEYRSHFYFRSVPKIKPLGEEETVRDSTAISVQLTPVFGITIPAIIRIGNSNAKITLSELELDIPGNAAPVFSLKFNRTGNFSVYGDLTVDHVSSQGKVTRVGTANGIAVYTPNTIRHFSFNLIPVNGVDFGSGKLKVLFSSANDAKQEIFAEAELVLQK